jgi:hypothetical protein
VQVGEYRPTPEHEGLMQCVRRLAGGSVPQRRLWADRCPELSPPVPVW